MLQNNKNVIGKMNKSNFVYEFTDEDSFSITEYKMLQGLNDQELAPCMKLIHNGKIQLFYVVDEYKSLTSFARTTQESQFLVVLSNLLKNIIHVQENGILSYKNLDINFEHVYIDTNKLDAKLIYLPSNTHFYEDKMDFEVFLREELSTLVESNPSLLTSKIKDFLNKLKYENMSLEELQRVLFTNSDSFNSQSHINNQETYVKQAQSTSTNQVSALKLIGLTNVPANTEFRLTNNEYIIGKSQADIALPFNTSISRNHCKIYKNGNDYYAQDLGSTNGTYLDNYRLEVNKPYQLKNNSVIKFANSEFRIVIE